MPGLADGGLSIVIGLGERVNVSTVVAERSSVPRASAPRGLPRGRLSGRHVVVVLAGVAALVANLAVLQAGTPRTAVVVTATALVAGQRVTPEDLVVVQVDGGGEVLDRLLRELPPTGMVAVRDLTAGEPLRQSDLAEVAAADPGLRRMSLPVEPERAAGGRLVPGDRVDVIVAIDGVASTIVAGAQIVAVADQEDRAFGTLGAFHVTVLVDASDVLCLASGLAAGDVHLVLATGATPAPVTACPT